ncbi:hypothetical protein AWH56_002855 [Anaerobacillus isosaccharinicus]|uniref:Uncharacterized protein n=1 Tax=Anaerobacillus isosaccharinicus TaxID=1532552 RepID=A0A1S2M9G6_9BACI|nr:hypothetical protein [Anaerobacillus isosaccharinicus]MBA5585017.1 hypothetical protein [Anaerobacillus isosaccharinicus]QOY36631.1 hypothetical protein AWH56_002855 [Anaerobacillus isosaccharinicus]
MLDFTFILLKIKDAGTSSILIENLLDSFLLDNLNKDDLLRLRNFLVEMYMKEQCHELELKLEYASNYVDFKLSTKKISKSTKKSVKI